MFSLGFSEILVILVVTIVFIGPDHLPEIAQKLGRMIWQFKHAAEEFKKEVALPSLGLDTDEFKKEIRDITNIKQNINETIKSLDINQEENLDLKDSTKK